MDGLSNYLIQHPIATIREIAIQFDRTPSWISSIRNSDLFRTFHAGRQEQHAHNLSISLVEKTHVIAEITTELLMDRVGGEDADPDKIPLMELLKIQDVTMRQLGFGGRAAELVVNHETNNFIVEDKEGFDRAQKAMHKLRGENDDAIIEGQVVGTPRLEENKADEYKQDHVEGREITPPLTTFNPSPVAVNGR